MTEAKYPDLHVTARKEMVPGAVAEKAKHEERMAAAQRVAGEMISDELAVTSTNEPSRAVNVQIVEFACAISCLQVAESSGTPEDCKNYKRIATESIMALYHKPLDERLVALVMLLAAETANVSIVIGRSVAQFV